jgi:2-amino-4-hydroxy-6-hydroxymethyldihydropteridine diphosphokinase
LGKQGIQEKVFHTAYLLLGANLGNRRQNLEAAAQKIAQGKIRITKESALYETAAWGKTDQPSFYNQAIEITTELTPEELVGFLQQVEQACGRVRLEKWGARIIDIDILYYDQEIIASEHLKIPHPELHNRRFALIPLAEIAPDFRHPVLNLTTTGLLEYCEDKLEVKKVGSF